jgi:hypothetical protein
MELTNKIWKEFVIGKTFDIYSTSSGIDKNKLINFEGNIPYITRTDKYNGYDMFVGTQVSKYKTDKNNVITIGLDTQTIFYQKSFFYTGQNIQILDFQELNEYNALFIIPLLKKQMTKFNWGGNGATLTRLKKTKILLPVNSKGEPDYAFMESYIRRKETELLKQYEKQMSTFESVVPLSKKEWKDFSLTELFDFVKGDQNNMASMKTGFIPLVSAKKSENGYKNFAVQTKKLYKGNSLTLNNDGDGGAGIAYYQPTDYLLDSHVTALYSKQNINKYALLYISRCITAQREKFGHGYSINNQRLKVFKLMLPTAKNGNPDFVYMENYMKALESEKVKQYLEYRKKKTEE